MPKELTLAYARMKRDNLSRIVGYHFERLGSNFWDTEENISAESSAILLEGMAQQKWRSIRDGEIIESIFKKIGEPLIAQDVEAYAAICKKVAILEKDEYMPLKQK